MLEKIALTKKKANIEIFTGLKGMKTAYSKELQYPKSETVYVLGVTSSEKYTKEVWDYFRNIHQSRRTKIGYKIKKLLAEEGRKSKESHEKKAELKFLPYDSMVAINVVGNLSTIGIFTEELIFISIESEEIANSFIKQFNLLWKIAKK